MADAGEVAGNTAFMVVATAMVLLMTPALGLFYGGLGRSRDVLSIMLVCVLCLAVVQIQWYLFGYSLALSPTATNQWIGNFDNAALTGVGTAPHPAAPGISALLYFVFLMQFAGITPALFVGAGAGRLRVLPLLLGFFVWSTIVYDPLAYAVWGLNGFLHTLGGVGVYDFAGGLPIHTAAGVAALIYGYLLGKPMMASAKPPPSAAPFHAPILVYLSTALLWAPWLFFNAGSECAANARAVQAAINSNLAASVAGLAWMVLEFIHTKRWGSVAFCTGAVAGLATVTPGSGYVPAWAAIVIGLLAALICQRVVMFKFRVGLDVDTLDVFAVHGVGGMLGTLLTGVFASSDIIALDGTISPGGWISGNWMQVPYQLAGIAYCAAYSAVVTFIIFSVIDRIPGLAIRAPIHAEAHVGLDPTDIGEHAYAYHAVPIGANDEEADPVNAESIGMQLQNLADQNRIDNLIPPSDDED